MDMTGVDGPPKKRNRKDCGKKKQKQKSRNPNNSSIAEIYQQLQKIASPDPAKAATKKEVLQQAKHYVMELENTLAALLSMKGRFLMDDSGPGNLEEIKEEYLQLLDDDQSSPPAEPVAQDEIDPVLLYLHPAIQKDLEESVEELKLEHLTESSSSQDLMDFEQYMSFYKQTADMLVDNQVVSPGQLTQPDVSKAIFNLWQELPQYWKAKAYQKPQHRNTASGGRSVSGAESQEASSSFLSSTPEDISLDDAFELAAEFLECSEKQMLSNPGSHESSPWVNPEGEKQLDQNISDFFRAKFFSCTQCDYESVLLQCTETFDDEDDL
ncbi:Stimulated by retinoic acid [Pristimantis euphronides]